MQWGTARVNVCLLPYSPHTTPPPSCRWCSSLLLSAPGLSLSVLTSSAGLWVGIFLPDILDLIVAVAYRSEGLSKKKHFFLVYFSEYLTFAGQWQSHCVGESLFSSEVKIKAYSRQTVKCAVELHICYLFYLLKDLLSQSYAGTPAKKMMKQ